MNDSAMAVDVTAIRPTGYRSRRRVRPDAVEFSQYQRIREEMGAAGTWT